MSRFTHLHIQGFRRLKDVDLELRPLCVMVGANGCGKTSLLDAIDLLSSSARGELNSKLNEFDGINSVLTAGGNDELILDLFTEYENVNPNLVHYNLTVVPKGVSHFIEKETLEQNFQSAGLRGKKYIESVHGIVRFPEEYESLRPEYEENPGETVLSLEQDNRILPNGIRRRLSSSAFYRVLNVGRRSPIKLPQKVRAVDSPGRDGEDLISCLFALRETNRDRFDLIEDTLRAAYPTFERLEFPPVAAGMLAMAWRDRNYSRPFYMHELSEGMLRYLWLTTLLQSPGLPSITLLDEPEVSLHPELLQLLTDQLREACQRTQLFVATHAEGLIRFLKPSEVLVFDLAEDGSAQATWAESLNLDEWLKDYTLDEVWRMGRIGGGA